MQDLLLNIIKNQNLKSVSVVGMAKNVGKTVAFNRLVQEAISQGLVPGLTSIGRDGEKTDAVFRIPKPGIFVAAGTLLATARGSLLRSEAKVEILAGTGFSTPLGEVMICRAAAPGYVELAGPVTSRQQQEVIHTLLYHGADLVLLDGALDRVSSAAPALAQGTILSTGAALGPSIPDVLAKTMDRVERFGLPPVKGNVLQLCRSIMERNKVVLVTRSGKIMVPAAEGSLVAGDLLREALSADTELVVMAGAVGNLVISALTEGVGNVRALHLVIRNGTCLLADGPVWLGFMAAGGSISVIEPIKLLAVTINPFNPTGPGFSPEKFLTVMGEALAPCTVVDVVLGKKYMAEIVF